MAKPDIPTEVLPDYDLIRHVASRDWMRSPAGATGDERLAWNAVVRTQDSDMSNPAKRMTDRGFDQLGISEAAQRVVETGWLDPGIGIYTLSKRHPAFVSFEGGTSGLDINIMALGPEEQWLASFSGVELRLDAPTSGDAYNSYIAITTGETHSSSPQPTMALLTGDIAGPVFSTRSSTNRLVGLLHNHDQTSQVGNTIVSTGLKHGPNPGENSYTGLVHISWTTPAPRLNPQAHTTQPQRSTK